MFKKPFFAVLFIILSVFYLSLGYVHAESAWTIETENNVTTFGIRISAVEVLPLVIIAQNSHDVGDNSTILALTAVWQPDNISTTITTYPRESGFPIGKILMKNTGFDDMPLYKKFICGITHCATIANVGDLPLSAVPLQGSSGVYVLPDNR